MGCRSDVRICMRKDDFYTMIEEGRRFGYAERCQLLDEERMNIKKYQDGTVVFGWDEIKWNNSFEDVSFVESFLDRMEDEGRPYAIVENGYGFDGDINREYWYDGDGDENADICHKIELEKRIWIQEEEE